MELIVFVKSESSVCCVRIIQIFESFSCGNEILVSDFCGDYKMFEGRKAKGAWGEDEGGGNSKAKEKKRKKRKTSEKVSFLFFTFFNFL